MKEKNRKMSARQAWLLAALAVASVGLIMLFLPRPDHQRYNYELNQPWKYQLLTAQFDVPVFLDSATANRLRDSIDRVFVPFVRKDHSMATKNVERFRKAIAGQASPRQVSTLVSAMEAVYKRGIGDATVCDFLATQSSPKLRMAETSSGNNSIANIDASEILSPMKAFNLMDSLYHRSEGDARISPEVARAINLCLTPNIVTDSISDLKYRNQEYLDVTGAIGVIKQGQRIVDRGEIVTPQIYTNLNTYVEMLERQTDDTLSESYFSLGQMLYLMVIIITLYLFLGIYRWRFFCEPRQMIFLMTALTVFVIFAILMFESVSYGIYLVPFAAIPVIIMIFFDARTAIFSLISVVMMSAIVSLYPLRFIFLELMAGMAATFSIEQLSKRSQLLRTAAVTFVTYVICYFIISLLIDGNLDNFSFKIIGMFGINSVILSFAYVLIFVIEKAFGFTSQVTLVELSDINNKLLRRLAEEAPGTFQHSMQVSTLAAEAARAIDANTLLVRVGALYHDIGKMESPVFFTENQHGVNPHEGLDPATSAKKIISHVTNGLELASKNKLPEKVRAFIAEHHGRGLTKYFYNTAVNNNPDKEINPEDFRYPGPNPQSKETAILMMADAVEAASRSLKEYTPQAICDLVDRIVDSQMKEGLFKDSPISCKDIETVKETFKKRLATIYHTRVAYPELQKKSTANPAVNSSLQ